MRAPNAREAYLSAPVSLAQPAPVLVPEAPAHAEAIERVLDRAFGPGRFAKPSEHVRAFAPALASLSRVASVGPAVVGVCRISGIAIGDAPAFFLGPLAVDPDMQHAGLGHLLVKAAIEACAADGRAGAIVLMGEPSFFSALGFMQIPGGRVQMPTPVEARRLQWLELRDGALDALSGAVSPPRAANPA